MKTNRIIMYPKDVMKLTGKSERYGRNLLNKIRESKSKGRRHFVSVNEFSEYTGLSVEEIASFLQD
jgi:hypothetical protein